MKLIHVEEPKHDEKIAHNKAKIILKIKPDVILFEFPAQNYSLSNFNKFESKEKPKQEIEKWKRGYEISAKKYPWLKSEYKIVEAIGELWNQGKQIYLFEIDAPVEEEAEASVETEAKTPAEQD